MQVRNHFKPVTNIKEFKRIKENINYPIIISFPWKYRSKKKHKRNQKRLLKQTKSNHKLVMLDYDKIENKLLVEIDDTDLINNIVLRLRHKYRFASYIFSMRCILISFAEKVLEFPC
jgi:hypothetical protein